jgi:hypothetical protein
MRAIRFSGERRVHWLDVDSWTFCGRRVGIRLVDELELAELPAGDGCDACEVMRSSSRARRRQPVTLAPSTGRLYTTGPLHHGPRSHPDRGRRLA